MEKIKQVYLVFYILCLITLYFLIPRTKTHTIYITEQSPEMVDTFFTTPFNNTIYYHSKIEFCSNDIVLFSISSNGGTTKETFGKLSQEDISMMYTLRCDTQTESTSDFVMNDSFPFQGVGTGINIFYKRYKGTKVSIRITTNFYGYHSWI
jgi:hypothetical protein